MNCPMCGKEFEKWHYKTFKLLQIMPANGEYAIYAHEDGTLDITKVDMLAIAKVTTIERYGHTAVNDCRFNKEKVVDTDNEIVAIQLREGYFNICNEDSNFAGLCYENQDPWECLGSLEWHRNEKFSEHHSKREQSKNGCATT